MARQSHASRSIVRGIEVVVVAGLVGLACLLLFVTLFLGPGLLPVVFILALAALAIEQWRHRDEANAIVRDAAAAGVPEPIVAWGRVVKAVGSCPDGGTPRRGTTFVVSADGRVWPRLCRHAEPKVLEAAGRIDAADGPDAAPARYQDATHLLEVDVYGAPAPNQGAIPAEAVVAQTDARAIASGRDIPSEAPEPSWMPRAVISGFMATVLMGGLFFVAFALARLIAIILPIDGPFSILRAWLRALTTNQVLDLAAGALYVAGTLHLVVGVIWALLYAGVFEPRLPGPSYFKGVLFALVPWLLSLVLFLPLVGGGFLGLDIGAGPLPALGNLVLHLVYGASLGALYGPLGDIPADQFPRTEEVDSPWRIGQEEQSMGRGVIAGALVGALVGAGGTIAAATSPTSLWLGAPPAAFFAVSVLLGATFGCFVGSMAGLARDHARS